MKPIYIYRPKPEGRKRYLILDVLLLVIILILSLTLSPILLKAHINKRGADEAGLTFSIGDLGINPLKGQLRIQEIKLFNKETKLHFAHFSGVVIGFNWFSFLSNERILSAHIKELSWTLSEDFQQELMRLKGYQDQRKDNFHVNELELFILRMNIREEKDNTNTTLLAMSDTNIKIQNFNLYRINLKTKFHLTSLLTSGGAFNLTGQAFEGDDKLRWNILGNMLGINQKTFEKLTGNDFPLEFSNATLNVKLNALSSEGTVEGTFITDLTELKIKPQYSDPVLRKKMVKTATDGLEIPFIINQNFFMDFRQALGIK